MSSPNAPSLSSPSKNYSLFLVIFSLAIGSFCIGTTEFVAMGLIQEIATDLNVSVPHAGYFISAYALGVMVGAPIIAILGAKVPRKTLLLALMLFYGLANAATALATSSEAMLVSRFIAGFPHGAYFGVAALVAAELAGKQRRAIAIAQVMMGLTIANVIGVPIATWLGQQFGWKTGFEFSAVIAFITLIGIGLFVPNIRPQKTASIRAELKGLKNINMWLTLAVGAIGFGGMFSVYSYVSPILTEYTHADISVVPIALAIWGVGMVIGGLVAGWLADRHLFKTMIGILISSALTFVLASFMMANLYTAITALFLIGFTVIGLGSALQTHLMDIAGDAQTLAASLNHSAFNLANALGAFLGGWVLSHNMGWLAPIWVGFVLSLGGLIVLLIALAYAKYSANKESVVA
ncbi:MFS transporter [Acinetobacter haemolyticus]|uniref:MFS transporter n=1 Tax=Acinetobacter haemolyticus TaxID=29430 RepID=A0AAJ3DAN4_ACIHA|nr:MFS transporter [Acinetobacter haemolyticus]NAR19348.1 MFS transporter [Acinetobacter haemolyticus]NAR30175.1 MFS transporter [Acinetobacter haemolyticus]NAR36941.1 MFS transporter [Acinetobacter haemolyticus]NAR48478.1 MFS transporter [Acinetobacter haemolyticus]NAR63855.1 MFS transporter [Acinetobacter haemolyticus]